jgi:Holliday junction DNA helicase RuvA
MIARITGLLESLRQGAALIRIGGEQASLTYEVLLPAFTEARLGDAIGTPVTLHTFHFLESQGQGASLLPRLAGFLTEDDLRFYLLFTTCKGIGYKRALRAMALESATIASAISDRDVSLLQSLPEVGRRTAETIIVTLRGKVDGFLSAAAYGRSAAGGGAATGEGDVAALPADSRLMAREALETLLALGENRSQAVQWIDRALSDADQRPANVTELISRVYRVKAGE